MTTISAAAIIAVLQAHYAAPEWATFAELRCGTGFSGPSYDQRIDLFAMNLYPSKGFRVLSIEVKVSKSDFMREIADPTKRAFAERVAKECYFATPPGLVRPDEIPEGWGLFEVTAAGPRTRKAARQRTEEPAWPLSFRAALARRTADPTPRASKTVWLHEGKEVNRETLLEIAKETAGADIEARRAEIERVARETVWAEEHVHRCSQMYEAVRRAMGAMRPTVAEFQTWAADRPTYRQSLAPSLNRLQTVLQDANRRMQSELAAVLETMSAPDQR